MPAKLLTDPNMVIFSSYENKNRSPSPLRIGSKNVFSIFLSMCISAYDGAGVNGRKKIPLYIFWKTTKKIHFFQKTADFFLIFFLFQKNSGIFFFCRSHLHHRICLNVIKFLLFQVHFLHADTCLFPKHLLTKVAEYPLPSYDTILVDDYWLSYVLSHLLHVPIWKIQGTNLFRSTPCAEDSNIALFLNPKVREERIKFYIYHMRKGWPNSAIESGR